MTIPIRLRKKYLVGRHAKGIKVTDAGAGKRSGPNKVSWKKGTGAGRK